MTKKKDEYQPTAAEVEEWRAQNRAFTPVATIAKRLNLPTKVVHRALYPDQELVKGHWRKVDPDS